MPVLGHTVMHASGDMRALVGSRLRLSDFRLDNGSFAIVNLRRPARDPD
jgi:hypothetical protein